MEEKINTTHLEDSVSTEVKADDYTNGALVLVGTVLVIVILRFLSNFAQKQKSTNS